MNSENSLSGRQEPFNPDDLFETDEGKWAIEYGHERPFQALYLMTQKQRDNIAGTLNITFNEKELASVLLQSKVLLNADLRGVIARLHYRLEQVNPFGKNISWRKVLERVLGDHLQIQYPADSDEEELEKLILEGAYEKAKSKADTLQGAVPLKAIFGKNRTGNILGMVLEFLDDNAEKILQTEDLEAVRTVLAVCRFTQSDQFPVAATLQS